MSQAKTVAFSPRSAQECKALLHYLNIKENRDAVNTRKTEQYMQAVSQVREQLREFFQKNPPRLTAFCAWKHIGADVACKRIAEQYSVPVWDILQEANPYIVFRSTTN